MQVGQGRRTHQIKIKKKKKKGQPNKRAKENKKKRRKKEWSLTQRKEGSKTKD